MVQAHPAAEGRPTLGNLPAVEILPVTPSPAVSATLKGKSEVSIGEVYASNTFTMMVVLGVCALIRPLAVSEAITHFALPFLVLAGVVIQVFITTGMKLKRWEALVLLGFYGFFVFANFTEVLGWTRALP